VIRLGVPVEAIRREAPPLSDISPRFATGKRRIYRTTFRMNADPAKLRHSRKFIYRAGRRRKALSISTRSKLITNLIKLGKILDSGAFEYAQGGVEVERRWVRRKTSPFSSLSIARSRSISRVRE